VADVVPVLGAAALAVPACACGALPLALRRTFDRSWVGLGGASAGGVMLAVSGGLALEGAERGAGALVAGVCAGLLFVQALRLTLARLGGVGMESLAGAGGRAAILIVAVLTAHSAAEGVGLASSFAGSAAFGWTIALALAVHKIPEGLAISLVLVPRGVRLRAAAGFSALAALPLPVLAVPAFLFVDAFRGILPAALGFAAGAMVLVVLTEMLPEAVRNVAPRSAFVSGAAAFLATVVLQVLVAVV
jgi:ZIP family zinc transporter